MTRWTRSSRSNGSSVGILRYRTHLLLPDRPRQQTTGRAPKEPGLPWQTVPVDDEGLLARAEAALTEIKVAQGLSEPHEAVLAALRIRLKGSTGKSLEEMLEAADDAPPDRLGEAIAKAEGKGKPSLDDLLTKEPKKKPEWPS